MQGVREIGLGVIEREFRLQHIAPIWNPCRRTGRRGDIPGQDGAELRRNHGRAKLLVASNGQPDLKRQRTGPLRVANAHGADALIKPLCAAIPGNIEADVLSRTAQEMVGGISLGLPDIESGVELLTISGVADARNALVSCVLLNVEHRTEGGRWDISEMVWICEKKSSESQTSLLRRKLRECNQLERGLG